MNMSSIKVVAIAPTSINTEATLYTPSTGARFRLIGGSLQSPTVGVVQLNDNTGGTAMAYIGLDVANKAVPFSFIPNGVEDRICSGVLSAAKGNVITGQGINANLSGYLLVVEE